MKKRDISSRVEATTRDIRPEELVEQTFNFPTLGVSVQAKTMDEALIKAKKLIKSNE
jgi:hypothetical protein